MSRTECTSSPVTVALADDYEIVVRGLASLLSPFASRVRVVEVVIHGAVRSPVDVVLQDVFGAGEVHTGDVDDALRNDFVGAVAVFTWNFDPHLVAAALERGVRGYLSKGLTSLELVEAIERIAAGEVVVARSRSRSNHGPRRWPGQLHDLSEGEAEVLALITQGYDNSAIAERLFISPNTLKSRIRSLYRKLGCQNRVQAAIWGIRHGFETDSGASSEHR
jgi:DNA-binding NarL/FixJ family response regulator